MRAPLRKFLFAGAFAACMWAMGAPAAGQTGTPQGRGPAKAKQAAGQLKAAQQNANPANQGGAGQAAGSSSGTLLDTVRREEEASITGLGLSYNPEGRRDPFISPAEAQEAEFAGDCEGEGVECWLISEVELSGILGRRSGGVALVVGPDGYGASLKAGDSLYDGEVRTVNSLSGVVVFRQRVNDPTRIKPYRDIEKKLSTREGGV